MTTEVILNIKPEHASQFPKNFLTLLCSNLTRSQKYSGLKMKVGKRIKGIDMHYIIFFTS